MPDWLDGLLNLGRQRDDIEIPIFPLNTVLFPGGRLPLKVFEARYLDMVSACLKQNAPFGVCLIREGAEVGGSALPAEVGTLAWIKAADMSRAGIFELTVEGGQRFVIEKTWETPERLRMARVHSKEDEPAAPVPPEFAPCRRLLRLVAEKHPETGLADQRDEMPWLGFRLAEVLPISLEARQAVLEMNDSHMRLELLLKIMRRSGLA